MALQIYGTYRFRDKDPVIDQLRTIKGDVKISTGELSAKSNVSTSTINNWFKGNTRRPQSATVEAVGRAMGYERKWVSKETGKVFEKTKR